MTLRPGVWIARFRSYSDGECRIRPARCACRGSLCRQRFAERLPPFGLDPSWPSRSAAPDFGSSCTAKPGGSFLQLGCRPEGCQSCRIGKFLSKPCDCTVYRPHGIEGSALSEYFDWPQRLLQKLPGSYQGLSWINLPVRSLESVLQVSASVFVRSIRWPRARVDPGRWRFSAGTTTRRNC